MLEELTALTKDKSVYEFLQQEVVDGYHDHEEFVRTVEQQYLESVDAEVRESMGLVSDEQYTSLFESYVQHVRHWVKGEKMRNRLTGEMERPDEKRMAEMEGIVMPRGEDPGEFRRGLIGQIGAHRLDNPEGAMDYAPHLPGPVPAAAGALLRGAQARPEPGRGERAQGAVRRAGRPQLPGAGAGEPDARRDA